MPNGGGTRDQPAGWFERGETLMNVAQSWHTFQRGDYTAAWQKAHPGLFDWGQAMAERIEGWKKNSKS